MTLVVKNLRERLKTASIADWPRILAVKHRASPAGAGFGSSRFSSPSKTFRILYAAQDFGTAFAEAVVRDRFEGKAHRYLYRPHLEGLCVTTLSSSHDLTLLDLTGSGAYELGVDTDAKGARLHHAGQAFSEALYTQAPHVDGILFDSRLTTAPCVAIYDRALGGVSGQPPIALVQAARLPDELKRLKITVRRERGCVTP